MDAVNRPVATITPNLTVIIRYCVNIYMCVYIDESTFVRINTSSVSR